MDKKKILIEIIYALPDNQELLSFEIEEGANVEQAIQSSGVLEKFPEIDLTQNKVGIFGKATKLTEELRDKDRIEIYRPLIADPKESRRKRAEKKEGQLKK
ncbi:MAG: RnfH family protein [Woeseiaceae bacterium]